MRRYQAFHGRPFSCVGLMLVDASSSSSSPRASSRPQTSFPASAAVGVTMGSLLPPGSVTLMGTAGPTPPRLPLPSSMSSSGSSEPSQTLRHKTARRGPASVSMRPAQSGTRRGVHIRRVIEPTPLAYPRWPRRADAAACRPPRQHTGRARRGTTEYAKARGAAAHAAARGPCPPRPPPCRVVQSEEEDVPPTAQGNSFASCSDSAS